MILSHKEPKQWSCFLGGGFKHFYFHPYLGFHDPFWLAHIFQLGGSTTNEFFFRNTTTNHWPLAMPSHVRSFHPASLVSNARQGTKSPSTSSIRPTDCNFVVACCCTRAWWFIDLWFMIYSYSHVCSCNKHLDSSWWVSSTYILLDQFHTSQKAMHQHIKFDLIWIEKNRYDLIGCGRFLMLGFTVLFVWLFTGFFVLRCWDLWACPWLLRLVNRMGWRDHPGEFNSKLPLLNRVEHP